MRTLTAFWMVVAVAVAVAVVGLSTHFLLRRETVQQGSVPKMADWHEVNWPYFRDQFPSGKAFECSAAACGQTLRVTFRAKIGFCNCATGVADDEELERIGDMYLVAEQSEPMRDGREISIGSMTGRSRPYSLNGRSRVYSIAFNNRCDVIVATAGPLEHGAGADDLEHIALSFLNSDTVIHWAERALGF